jgi:hypothetical protein
MEMRSAQTLPARYLRDRSEQGNHVSQTLGGRHRQHEVHDVQQHTRTTFRVVPPISFFAYHVFREHRIVPSISLAPADQHNGSRHAHHACPPTLRLSLDTRLPHGWRMLGSYNALHAPCSHELYASSATLAHRPE